MLASSEILTPPPLHPLASVYPQPLVRGEDTLARWREGGGSIVRKTPDTALYSIYVSALRFFLYKELNSSLPRNWLRDIFLLDRNVRIQGFLHCLILELLENVFLYFFIIEDYSYYSIMEIIPWDY